MSDPWVAVGHFSRDASTMFTMRTERASLFVKRSGAVLWTCACGSKTGQVVATKGMDGPGGATCQACGRTYIQAGEGEFDG